MCLLREAEINFYLLLWGAIIRGGATIRINTVFSKIHITYLPVTLRYNNAVVYSTPDVVVLLKEYIPAFSIRTDTIYSVVVMATPSLTTLPTQVCKLHEILTFFVVIGIPI